MASAAMQKTRTRKNSKQFKWPGTKSGRRRMAEADAETRDTGTWRTTKMKVYLDNSATTAMAPEVIEAMLPYFSEEMGNAQSVHSFGQRAKAAVEKARRK